LGKTFYYYDGEGRRVGKVSSGVMEIFVYDARGQLAAEYGGTSEVTGTHYLTVDHLGSTRVITDESKAVIQCRDYLPFGGELLASAQNERNGISCYSGDTGLRQKFTAKERDSGEMGGKWGQPELRDLLLVSKSQLTCRGLKAPYRRYLIQVFPPPPRPATSLLGSLVIPEVGQGFLPLLQSASPAPPLRSSATPHL
jgi:hypothetical protein